MFGRRITLFRILGFEVRLDLSWFILAALITWSLADQAFPQRHPGLPIATYWLMGGAGALGLFASILLHELSHSLVARVHGVTMRGITLFIFGGVAEMDEEPKRPWDEFLIAAVGPLCSAVLGASCWVTALIPGLPVPVSGLLTWLGVTNFMLAIFNLLPAFPLDGGRMLRAALWAWRSDLRSSTRLASNIGVGFGTALILLGVAQVFFHSFVSGLWTGLIGFFLRSAAAAPYQQLVVRQALSGETVARLMKTELVTVPRAIPVQELVDSYILRHHFKMYPVVDGERLVGCITVDDVKQLPRDEWSMQSVGAIARQLDADNTIAPETDAMQALALMNRTGQSRLMVVREGALLGIVSVRDIMGHLALKMELEGAR